MLVVFKVKLIVVAELPAAKTQSEQAGRGGGTGRRRGWEGRAALPPQASQSSWVQGDLRAGASQGPRWGHGAPGEVQNPAWLGPAGIPEGQRKLGGRSSRLPALTRQVDMLRWPPPEGLTQASPCQLTSLSSISSLPL